MTYDLYAMIPCQSKNDVDGIVTGRVNEQVIPDIYARIQLLAPALLREERWDLVKGKDYTHDKYRSLLFKLPDHTQTDYATKLIASEKRRLEQLGLWQPAVPDLGALLPYSAFLQFRFTLASPYLGRDDEVFHINDNPVRKDKVFKVPMVAGTSWKGNIRWTAMKTGLEPVRDDPQEFARRRLRHTLMFGTEKGFEASQGWEQFLDHRCVTDPEHHENCEDEKCQRGGQEYRRLLRDHFNSEAGLPHVGGWLRFYPTFLDRISLEVINPHERATRAGKQPIYFESVPTGASGVFSLLYVPFNGVAEAEARADLALVADAICEMMLIYGFSAKKSSGFGEANDDLAEAKIVAATGQWPLTKLSTLKDEVNHVQWG